MPCSLKMVSGCLCMADEIENDDLKMGNIAYIQAYLQGNTPVFYSEFKLSVPASTPVVYISYIRGGQ